MVFEQTILSPQDIVNDMEIVVYQENDVTIVELEGAFDSNAAHEVQEKILVAAQNTNKMLLDMSRVTYMSSAGLRILLLLYRRISANIGQIVITGLSEELEDIMSITGFLDFFTTYDNREAGLKMLHDS